MIGACSAILIQQNVMENFLAKERGKCESYCDIRAKTPAGEVCYLWNTKENRLIFAWEEINGVRTEAGGIRSKK